MPRKKPAAHAAHSLGREINLAARSMRALLDARLHRAGTNFATWTALYVLDLEGPMIQRELAAKLDVEGPTLVRRLDQLEADGLVVRNSSATDRRTSEIALTDAGRALFRRVRTSVAETEGELLPQLDSRELETARRVLRQLTEAARALTRSNR